MSLHKKPLAKTPCSVFSCDSEQQNNFLVAVLTDRSFCKLSLHPGVEMNKTRKYLKLVSSTWTVCSINVSGADDTSLTGRGVTGMNLRQFCF